MSAPQTLPYSTGTLRQKATVHGTNCNTANRSFFKRVCSTKSNLGRDRFASPGRVISSAGIRIISIETIDQTETGRRRLTVFTFLRLQLKYNIYKRLNLHRHDLAVAHRGAGLVCYSVTYLAYKSACPAAYAIPLSHISDIRESARNFWSLTENYISNALLIFMGNLMLPLLGDAWRSYMNLRRKQLIHFYCVALIS